MAFSHDSFEFRLPQRLNDFPDSGGGMSLQELPRTEQHRLHSPLTDANIANGETEIRKVHLRIKTGDVEAVGDVYGFISKVSPDSGSKVHHWMMQSTGMYDQKQNADIDFVAANTGSRLNLFARGNYVVAPGTKAMGATNQLKLFFNNGSVSPIKPNDVIVFDGYRTAIFLITKIFASTPYTPPVGESGGTRTPLDVEGQIYFVGEPATLVVPQTTQAYLIGGIEISWISRAYSSTVITSGVVTGATTLPLRDVTYWRSVDVKEALFESGDWGILFSRHESDTPIASAAANQVFAISGLPDQVWLEDADRRVVSAENYYPFDPVAESVTMREAIDLSDYQPPFKWQWIREHQFQVQNASFDYALTLPAALTQINFGTRWLWHPYYRQYQYGSAWYYSGRWIVYSYPLGYSLSQNLRVVSAGETVSFTLDVQNWTTREAVLRLPQSLNRYARPLQFARHSGKQLWANQVPRANFVTNTTTGVTTISATMGQLVADTAIHGFSEESKILKVYARDNGWGIERVYSAISFDTTNSTVQISGFVNNFPYYTLHIEFESYYDIEVDDADNPNFNFEIFPPLRKDFDAGCRVSRICKFQDQYTLRKLPDFYNSDRQARTVDFFMQGSWAQGWITIETNTPSSGFNFLDYPVATTNDHAIDSEWAIVVTAGNLLDVFSKSLGVKIKVAHPIGTDLAPINPMTGGPYFTLRAVGWGSGVGIGNALRFTTVAAATSFWSGRVVEPDAATDVDYEVEFLVRGHPGTPSQ